MGLRAGLDRCGKSRPPPPGFDPRTVQPVASRCTDYTTRPTKVVNSYRTKRRHIIAVKISVLTPLHFEIVSAYYFSSFVFHPFALCFFCLPHAVSLSSVSLFVYKSIVTLKYVHIESDM